MVTDWWEARKKEESELMESFPSQIVRKMEKWLLKDRGGKNKMVEEKVDKEYISLHGYIRNTPSDTEVHAEH